MYSSYSNAALFVLYQKNSEVPSLFLFNEQASSQKRLLYFIPSASFIRTAKITLMSRVADASIFQT